MCVLLLFITLVFALPLLLALSQLFFFCFTDGEPLKLPESLESLPKSDHFPTQRHRWNTNEVRYLDLSANIYEGIHVILSD